MPGVIIVKETSKETVEHCEVEHRHRETIGDGLIWVLPPEGVVEIGPALRVGQRLQDLVEHHHQLTAGLQGGLLVGLLVVDEGYEEEGGGAGEEEGQVAHGHVENWVAAVGLVGRTVLGVVELCEKEEGDGCGLNQHIRSNVEWQPGL